MTGVAWAATHRYSLDSTISDSPYKYPLSFDARAPLCFFVCVVVLVVVVVVWGGGPIYVGEFPGLPDELRLTRISQ